MGHQQNITVASFESSSVKLDLKSQTWANPEIIHFNWRQWPLKIKFELYAFDLTSQTLQVNFMSLFIKKASWKSWMVKIKIFFVSQLNLRLDTIIINFYFDCPVIYKSILTLIDALIIECSNLLICKVGSSKP